MALARFTSLRHLNGLGVERQAGERACVHSDCISVLSEGCALAECRGARAGAATCDLRSLNHWDVKIQSKVAVCKAVRIFLFWQLLRRLNLCFPSAIHHGHSAPSHVFCPGMSLAPFLTLESAVLTFCFKNKQKQSVVWPSLGTED